MAIDVLPDNLSCFKAYDVRGRVPDELNGDIAYRIGRAYAEYLGPRRVIVGRDVRLTSGEIAGGLEQGLRSEGVHVFDIGVCGTEEVYFAVFSEKMDGGIMVTASHNPKDYNGMKFVREDSKPISGDSGLDDIRDMAVSKQYVVGECTGDLSSLSVIDKYISHILSYVDTAVLRPHRVVVNAGNGCAGRIIDLLERHLPIEFVKINHGPDGNFPNGVPNPLLPENRDTTSRAVREHGADMGIAWDGDFDRCFLFDESGNFMEGYYIVGLLASAVLGRNPESRIIHDPRLMWNTLDIVSKSGGVPVMSKTGHAFIKERMRTENAAYGGEMSSHHYFRDFAFCDSGMIPWLMVLEIMSMTGKPLSQLVQERISLFPSSGEINRKLTNPASAIKSIEARYRPGALSVDYTDGLSMEFDKWRFNLRSSNTEPVVRLNVESRGDEALMKEKTSELLGLIGSK